MARTSSRYVSRRLPEARTPAGRGRSGRGQGVRVQQAEADEVGDEVATRTAFGKALAAVGAARGDVVVLDGEVSDSTRTEYFAQAHPDRFFQCYIAEQQMIAPAVGMQVRGWKPPDEQLSAAGIDAQAITHPARTLVRTAD